MPNSEIDSTNVNSIILDASTLMDSLHFNDALGIIDNAISIYANNYELIYMKAICSEHLNNLATAYYLYKLSIYIAQYENQSEDVAIIQASLNQLCNNSDNSEELIPYNLNKALENIIKERILNNEFLITNLYSLLSFLIAAYMIVIRLRLILQYQKIQHSYISC